MKITLARLRLVSVFAITAVLTLAAQDRGTLDFFLLGAYGVTDVTGIEMREHYKNNVTIYDFDDIPSMDRLVSHLRFNTIHAAVSGLGKTDSVFERILDSIRGTDDRGISRLILYDGYVHAAWLERFQYQAELFTGEGKPAYRQEAKYLMLDVPEIPLPGEPYPSNVRVFSAAGIARYSLDIIDEGSPEGMLQRNTMYVLSARLKRTANDARLEIVLHLQTRKEGETQEERFTLNEMDVPESFAEVKAGEIRFRRAPGIDRDVVVRVEITGANVEVDYVALSSLKAFEFFNPELANPMSPGRRLRQGLESRARTYYNHPPVWQIAGPELGSDQGNIAYSIRLVNALLRKETGGAVDLFCYVQPHFWRIGAPDTAIVNEEKRRVKRLIRDLGVRYFGVYLYPFASFNGNSMGLNGRCNVNMPPPFVTPIPNLPDGTVNPGYYLTENALAETSRQQRKAWGLTVEKIMHEESYAYFMGFTFLKPMRQTAEISRDLGVPWIFTPQAHVWRFGTNWPWRTTFRPCGGPRPDFYDNKEQREPTVEEIRLSVYLALCYGAKGILYFNYASAPDQALVDAFSAGHYSPDDSLLFDPTGRNPAYAPGDLGIIDPNGLPRTRDCYGGNKWAMLGELDSVLETLGKVQKDLTWVDAISVDTEAEIMKTNPYIRGVSTFLPSSTFEQGNDSPRYVEIGILHDSAATVFLWVVNKRVERQGKQRISVMPGPIFRGSILRVEEVLSGRIENVLNTGTSNDNGFTAWYEPGEGKLWKVEVKK